LHWFLERGQAVALWEKIMVSKQMTLRKINTPNFNGSWFYKIIVAKLDFMKIICPKTKGNGSKMFQMAEKNKFPKWSKIDPRSPRSRRETGKSTLNIWICLDMSGDRQTLHENGMVSIRWLRFPYCPSQSEKRHSGVSENRGKAGTRTSCTSKSSCLQLALMDVDGLSQ
jgi:hypothetical protein